MLRVTASTVTFAINQANVKVTSAVANLTDLVPSSAKVRPTALSLASGVNVPADLTVTEIVMRSTKNPEVQHRLYKGPAVGLKDVLGAFARDAVRNQTLTPLEFAPDHGMEIEFTYSNGATVVTAAPILWDVANQSTEEFAKVAAGIQIQGHAHQPGQQKALKALGKMGEGEG